MSVATANNTKPTSNKTQPRSNGKSRYAQKKNRNGNPAPRKTGPKNTYLSSCCNVPARKPKAAEKQIVVDPETKRTKNVPRGLGKWRCTGCSKVCSVRPVKYVVGVDLAKGSDSTVVVVSVGN